MTTRTSRWFNSHRPFGRTLFSANRKASVECFLSAGLPEVKRMDIRKVEGFSLDFRFAWHPHPLPIGRNSVLPKRTMTVESPSGYKQFLTHKFTPLRIKSEHFCDSVSFQTTEYGAVERCPPLRSVMKSTFKALQLTEGKSGMSQVRGRNIWRPSWIRQEFFC